MDASADTSPSTSAESSLTRGLTAAAAVAVAAGGLLHLMSWNDQYREIPDGAAPGLWVVKLGFPINAAASVILAVTLVGALFAVLRPWRRHLLGASLVVQLGSIAALVLSRGPGIFGWEEKGYQGDAGQILLVEVVATLLLIVALVIEARGTDRTAPH